MGQRFIHFIEGRLRAMRVSFSIGPRPRLFPFFNGNSPVSVPNSFPVPRPRSSRFQIFLEGKETKRKKEKKERKENDRRRTIRREQPVIFRQVLSGIKS